MSGFSIEWLNLREASDHKARDRHLLKTAANWLNDLKSKDKVIVDLGSGTGSTIRGLQRYTTLAPSIQWRLVDNDPELQSPFHGCHNPPTSLKTHSLNILLPKTADGFTPVALHQLLQLNLQSRCLFRQRK